MRKTYTLNVAGVTRELPLCPVNEKLDIAAFVMFSDVELTVACAEALLKKVPESSYLIVLDVAGKNISSEELAKKITELGTAGQGDITFLIGGAFGLSPAVVAAARERLSFSRMTFTHQMIRLLLVEQIYRAFKIARGEKYHN